jgi:hypothetical protein
MKNGSFKWKSKDGNVMVIDIDDDHHDGTHKKEKHKNVIKKKIVIKDEN